MIAGSWNHPSDGIAGRKVSIFLVCFFGVLVSSLCLTIQGCGIAIITANPSGGIQNSQTEQNLMTCAHEA